MKSWLVRERSDHPSLFLLHRGAAFFRAYGKKFSRLENGEECQIVKMFSITNFKQQIGHAPPCGRHGGRPSLGTATPTRSEGSRPGSAGILPATARDGDQLQGRGRPCHIALPCGRLVEPSLRTHGFAPFPSYNARTLPKSGSAASDCQ